MSENQAALRVHPQMKHNGFRLKSLESDNNRLTLPRGGGEMTILTKAKQAWGWNFLLQIANTKYSALDLLPKSID